MDKIYMVMVRGLAGSTGGEEEAGGDDQPNLAHVFVRLDCDFEDFISIFSSNHILAVLGDHVEKLVTYCEIAGIKPIVLGGRSPPGIYWSDTPRFLN